MLCEIRVYLGSKVKYGRSFLLFDRLVWVRLSEIEPYIITLSADYLLENGSMLSENASSRTSQAKFGTAGDTFVKCSETAASCRTATAIAETEN